MEKINYFLKNLPFNFSAFVKTENLKRDLTYSEENNEENISHKKDTSKIISNTKEYAPRKLSANEENKQNLTYPRKESYSKFDEHDLYSSHAKQQRPSAPYNNKFDMVYEGKKLNKNQQSEKRSKAYSIHENYHQPHAFVPLNKNYKIEDNYTESSKITKSLN
jgi:hypothetical protein